MKAVRRMLWWGRFDPEYSRNRVIRKLLAELGWEIIDFHPMASWAGAWQARFQSFGPVAAVWIPCFRQRDISAAHRWTERRSLPLIIDPLISAYDKQVYERSKLDPKSGRAERLLAHERKLFQCADMVIADTPEHARFFRDVLGVSDGKLHIVFVGAEEPFFFPAPPQERAAAEPLHVLFFGSFIGLQAPQLIVQAARRHRGRTVIWHLLGSGPLLDECRKLAIGLDNVVFEKRISYETLPRRIHQADLVLGIFGDTHKSGRVIPNKVYQALACARPVVTCRADAYPEELRNDDNAGILWVSPGSSAAIADQVAQIAAHKERLADLSQRAQATYQRWFSNNTVKRQLADMLERLLPQR